MTNQTAASKSLARIDAMIKDVERNQTRFYVTVQHCLVAIMCHTIQHRDWNKERVNALIKALGKGTRKEGCVRWLQTFMGLKFDEKTQAFIEWNKDVEALKANLEKAKKTDWHTMARTENVKAYDINAEIVLITNHINKAKARIEADIKAGKEIKDNLSIDQAKWNNLLVALGINNAMETLSEVKQENVA